MEILPVICPGCGCEADAEGNCFACLFTEAAGGDRMKLFTATLDGLTGRWFCIVRAPNEETAVDLIAELIRETYPGWNSLHELGIEELETEGLPTVLKALDF